MTIARMSFGKTYQCTNQWPDDCFVQCGDCGIVFASGEDVYTTAFFEALPRNPNTFIRGEGKTVQEAEQSAWNQLDRITRCKEHIFERKGYSNGAGFCINCGLFKSRAFEPLTLCCKCGKPTNYSTGSDRSWWCERCNYLKPDELRFVFEIMKADYECE